MTRETRIGLIVGLAFIVLFGVVLAELGPSGEAPEDKSDGADGGFYATAPVTSPPQAPDRPEVLPLTARRRTEAQGPARARGTQQPPGRSEPARARVVVPSRRTVPPVVSHRTEPARPLVSGGSREMTIDQLGRFRSEGSRAVGSLRIYVTRRGDTLTALARKFYRTPSRKAVMKIFNANRSVLKSPDSLGVGVKIVIPK